MKHVKILLFIALVVGGLLPARAVDAAYYSSLNGKSDSQLRSALTQLLYNKHTLFSKYDWDFPYDYDNSGNMLDIYSDCGFNSNNSYTSDYKCCCDAINREHVVCQSNFGGSGNKDKIPQYSDRHHLFPVDGRANGHRSDLPFGECSGGSHGSCSNSSTVYPSEGTSTCSNHEFGKSGTSTFSVALPSGGGKVYEVGDDYKGDIARAILYMVVRYAESTYCRLPDGAKYCTSSGGGTVSSNLTTANSYPVTAWANTTQDKVGQMFASSLSTNFGLSEYGKALLLKWHRQDPVSQKEIDRNSGVEAVQGNRNPFVDYPCLVEYLWGNKAGETFNTSNVTGSFEGTFTPGSSDGCTCGTNPAITLPTGTIAFGATNTATPLNQTATVRGTNLTSGNLTLSITGTNAAMFSLSTTNISKANAESGKDITITYAPTAVGSHTATLNIYGCGIAQGSAHTVTLTGTCEIRYTVTWKANGANYHSNTVASGGRPDIPNAPDDCSGSRVFVGWTDNSSYSGDGSGLFTTTAPTVSQDKTFYAVYATVSGDNNNEFALYSGDLEEGDYILYYSGKAMKAVVSSNRLSYETVSPSNDKITTSDASIVWHIEEQGDYWTIYNAGESKYAASTGVASKAQLLDADDDGKTLWSVEGTSTYDFVNKKNSEVPVNAYLRNNGTYGFSCYSSSTGGALSLYKRTASATYSEYSTSCSTAPKVTVTFYPNGGTGSEYTQQVSQSTSTALTANTFTREGYTFAGWATSANGNVIYADGANINTNSDINLYAKWTALPTYTVTFMNNGAEHATRSGWAGQTMTAVANPTTCDGYTFEGWSTSQYATDNTSAPSLSTPTTIPAANTTYYAVYSKTESGGGDPVATNNYKKITSTSELTDGKYLIVANNSGAYNAMSTTWKDTYYLAGSNVTPADDIITTTTANIIWQITVSNSQVTIYNATSHYLYIESSTSGNKTYYNIKLGDNTTDNKFTYSVSDGAWTLTSVTYSTRQLEYYTSSTRWAYYTSQDAPIYLYKQQYDTGSTTYHTTAPNCCQATLTVVSPDDTKGTVGIE